MKDEISDAISEKRMLELRYNGYLRTVEPHAYGRDKNGDQVLRCFQINGGSDSGERVGWKLLKVADAYAVHVLDQAFQQRPEYKRNDKAMDHIFCQL